MFSFVKPEDGDREHELILSIEEDLMQELEIPYQLIKMVTGDLGLPAARKFDIEAWVPTQQMYRETHSCSTTTDFQARRLNTRYRDPNGGNSYVHTLNGTVFAIGRTIAALMENHQQADGSIRIPAALVPYFGSDILS
jgi:seryl-tRNA synthetase